MKYWELKREIKPLIDWWMSIDIDFKVGDWYSYEVVWNIITLTMNNIDSKWKVKDHIILSRFRNLVKLVWAEIADIPYNWEIWYDDGLRWLYHHYPYWDWNFTNCCLIDGQSNILAVQYNWCKHTRCIQIEWTLNKWYIVLNNKKKVEWTLKYKHFDKLLPILKLI